MARCDFRVFAAAVGVFALAAANAHGAYARAAWRTMLPTFQHGVSGKVTIIDADTLKITNFNYDGGGLSLGVFVRLGTVNTQMGFVNGKSIGSDLRRAGGYHDETVTVDLPAGMTLDGWNAVCIWCVQAQANFGSGTFVAPPCPADVNGDGVVNSTDLGLLLGAWGTDEFAMDVNHDGVVNSTDLGLMLGGWGVCG